MPELTTNSNAVAVIDALGFKELSRTHSSADILNVLRKAKLGLRTDALVHNIFEDRTRLQTTVFSDTAIFAARTIGEKPAPKDAVQALGMSVCDFITIASGTTPPLIYRGCISVGDLDIDEEEEILVGQSLNDAAEWHERADAAVVWMTPRAVRMAELGDDESPLFFRWPVPLKDGGKLETLVLNPFWSQIRARGFNDVAALANRYLAPFDASDSIDVVRKRQNTAAFLVAALRYSEAAGKKHPHSLWQAQWDDEDDSPALEGTDG